MRARAAARRPYAGRASGEERGPGRLPTGSAPGESLPHAEPAGAGEAG
jgi:hypothetical protein